MREKQKILPPILVPGLVIRSQAGYLTVHTEEGDVLSRLRGHMRQGRASSDRVAVGDRVLIRINRDGTGTINEVLPRKTVFSRQLSGVHYEYQQILVANLDLALLVFACANPSPRLRMLDRFLVVTERGKIPAAVIANKIDLESRAEAEKNFELYRKIGYPVIYTSAKTGEGVDEVRSLLVGKISTLAGPSGAGKTSLLNAIQPGLAEKVGRLSEGVGKGKGRHTTQLRRLFPIPGGGYIADLPGLRTLALWDIQGEELDAYFKEIAPLVSGCQFSDCTHSHEPGCAVRRAVDEGKVDPRRYDSYLRLRFGRSGVDELDEAAEDAEQE